MLKKTIIYEDFNGEKRTEDFYFNMTKAEVLEKETSIPGGMTTMLNTIIAKQDITSMIRTVKEFVLDSYGEKSADGRRFMKKDVNGNRLSDQFEDTEAYSQLMVELTSDADALAAFFNGILPNVNE